MPWRLRLRLPPGKRNDCGHLISDRPPGSNLPVRRLGLLASLLVAGTLLGAPGRTTRNKKLQGLLETNLLSILAVDCCASCCGKALGCARLISCTHEITLVLGRVLPQNHTKPSFKE